MISALLGQTSTPASLFESPSLASDPAAFGSEPGQLESTVPLALVHQLIAAGQTLFPFFSQP